VYTAQRSLRLIGRAGLVPAGTPAEIVALLNREIVKAMQLDDVKAKCAELGFDPVGDSPQAFAVYIKQDIENGARSLRMPRSSKSSRR
jgi:tripartite-type tricarboxylate transporter receptor subunit TctC